MVWLAMKAGMERMRVTKVSTLRRISGAATKGVSLSDTVLDLSSYLNAKASVGLVA